MSQTGLPDAHYFVAKCQNMDALRRCVETKVWALKKRVHSPQPHIILANAFCQGPVILVFSVNNCHGWHGYCCMNSQLRPPKPDPLLVSNPKSYGAPPEEKLPTSTSASETLACKLNVHCPDHNRTTLEMCHHKSRTDINTDLLSLNDTTKVKSSSDEHNSLWHYFDVKWCTEFVSCFGEACLSSSKTAEFFLLDGFTPLNKARNWQEMSTYTGRRVCSLIDVHYADLTEKQKIARELILARKPLPFLHLEEDTVKEGGKKHWKEVVEKVERDLGKVHLACPFGSQRYNLHEPSSDIDAFIVYQSRTRDLLGFDPPKMTVKNSEKETCDYTVLEVKRYCELLLSFDARCVETLFMHDSTIVHASREWREIHSFRYEFLTRKCLEKYLGDALGSNGVQKLYRLQESMGVSDNDFPPPKMAKLAYIVIRLLQNAVNIVNGELLQVFREDSCSEQKILLKIRRSELSIHDIKDEIHRLQDIVDQKRDGVASEFPSTKATLESWLLSLRFSDFQQHPPDKVNFD